MSSAHHIARGGGITSKRKVKLANQSVDQKKKSGVGGNITGKKKGSKWESYVWTDNDVE